MSPRAFSLPALGATVLLLLQVPACGLNTSGGLESGSGLDASDGIDAQGSGGVSGKDGGVSAGGTAGQAGKAGAGGASGKGGMAGAAGTAANGGAGGASGEGGALPEGGAGAAGEGGSAEDAGSDGPGDAPDDVFEAGVDSGPACGLQDNSHPECNACMIDHCLSECQECAGESECVKLVNCMSACNGDTECQSDCWDDHPTGRDGASQLGGEDGCLRDECADECKWLPPTGGGGCAVSPVRREDSRGWMVGILAAAGLALAAGRKRSTRSRD